LYREHQPGSFELIHSAHSSHGIAGPAPHCVRAALEVRHLEPPGRPGWADGGDRLVELPTVDPFSAEADAVSLALRDGRTEAPEVPWAHSRSIARLLDQWRAGLDG